MPSAPSDKAPENAALAERITLGMDSHGYRRRGKGDASFTAFAERYMGDPKKSPMVSDWRKGRYGIGDSILRKLAKDWSCSFMWLKFGEGEPPSWFTGAAAQANLPRTAKSPRTQELNDLIAIQIAIESLAGAVLTNVRGAAEFFQTDVNKLTKKLKFSKDHGLLGTLLDIAEEAQADAEAASPAVSRSGPAKGAKL